MKEKKTNLDAVKSNLMKNKLRMTNKEKRMEGM